MFLDRNYINEKQLRKIESLCIRPLVFQFVDEESYPEIEIHIKRDNKPSVVKNALEPVLREAGFDIKMVQLKAYDKGERGYNELVLFLDLKLFSDEQIFQLVSIVQEIVKSYASLTNVEY